MPMAICKPLTEDIELLLCQLSEAMVQKPLLCSLIGVSAHEHQDEPRQDAEQGKD